MSGTSPCQKGTLRGPLFMRAAVGTGAATVHRAPPASPIATEEYRCATGWILGSRCATAVGRQGCRFEKRVQCNRWGSVDADWAQQCNANSAWACVIGNPPLFGGLGLPGVMFQKTAASTTLPKLHRIPLACTLHPLKFVVACGMILNLHHVRLRRCMMALRQQKCRHPIHRLP